VTVNIRTEPGSQLAVWDTYYMQEFVEVLDTPDLSNPYENLFVRCVNDGHETWVNIADVRPLGPTARALLRVGR